MSEEKKDLIVFVDDLRDPKQFLGDKCPEGIVWIKTYPEAIDYLFANEGKIVELHLDQYLGHDPIHLGSNLLELVHSYMAFDDQFALIKRIYLHSSDRGIIDGLIRMHGDFFKERDVELINNHKAFR